MKPYAIAIFVTLLTGVFCPATEVQMAVSASRDQIYIGESVILEVKVSGEGVHAEPDLSALKDCQIRSLGSHSSRRISIINGRMESSSDRLFTYELVPAKPGVFVAGPINLSVDGRELRSDGPRINVQGIERQEDVKIEIAASRDAVLLDEPFEVTLTLMIQRLEGNLADSDPLDPRSPPTLTAAFLDPNPIPGLKMPDIQRILGGLVVPRDRAGIAINNYVRQRNPFDPDAFFNFNVDDFFENRSETLKFALERSPSESGGKSYFAYRLKLTYQPTEEGNYTFGPAVLKGKVIVGTDAQGRPVTRSIFAVGPAATVRVTPPPDKDRPAHFIGALGTGLNAEAELDTQTCKVGDPLTLTLRLSGPVRLDKIFPLKLSLQGSLLDNFTIYDDTVETVKGESRVEFRYKIRPSRAGTLEVPPILVSYFDTGTRSYRTVSTPPIPVRVRASEEITEEQTESFTNLLQESGHPAGNEMPSIAPIRTDAEGAEPQSLFGDSRVLLPAAAGPLLFAFTVLSRSLLDRRARSRAERVRRSALQRALRSVEKARRLAQRDPVGSRASAYAALKAFLAERFSVPGRGLTHEDARDLLPQVAAYAAHSDSFCRAMEGLLNAGYGVRDRTVETDILCIRAIEALKRLKESEAGS